MNVVVVGFGSIGRRHTRVLQALGCNVSVVSSRPQLDVRRFESLESAFAAQWPDYVVIANETVAHASSVDALVALGFSGKVLVEKPLCEKRRDWPSRSFEFFGVGYNLRFHPAVLALKQRLADSQCVSWRVDVGQNLNQWRPDRALGQTYSASAALGGGVLRDLSHELDYLQWLAGKPTRVTALGGNFGALDIDADESWVLLCDLGGRVGATISMNFLDNAPHRTIQVSTTDTHYEADLVNGRLLVDGSPEEFVCDSDHTYREMHQAVLAGSYNHIASWQDGCFVVEMIEAVERAAASRGWESLQ